MGLSHEPRSLGRLITLGWLFLLIFRVNGYKFIYYKISLSLGLALILLIFSFSTYFIFFLGILIVLRKKLLRFNLKSIFGLGLIIFIFFQIISFNEEISVIMLYKLASVTEGRIDLNNYYPNEPFLFSTFEVFDRAALNFSITTPIIYFLEQSNLIYSFSSKWC